MEPVTLWDTRVERFDSAIVDQEFELQVAVMAPEDWVEPVPLVYLTDANTLFAATSQMIGVLQLAQQLPPLCLVGVGYPFEHAVPNRPDMVAEWYRLRARDLLSTTLDISVLPRPVVLDTWGGGAPDFLDCIAHEIDPKIAAMTSVDLSRRTLVGHSAGAHLALYATLSRPGFFRTQRRDHRGVRHD